jgi:hypothetical protein
MRQLWRLVMAWYWNWQTNRLCSEWCETVRMGQQLEPGEDHNAYDTLGKAQEAMWCKAMRKAEGYRKGGTQ